MAGDLAGEREVLVAVAQNAIIVVLGRTFSSPEVRHEFSLLVPESVRDKGSPLTVHILDPEHRECGARVRQKVYATSRLAFTREDPGDSYGIGWSTFGSLPERGASSRWAMGPKATLFLDLPQRSVVLRFHAGTHSANPEQELTAVVNGSQVGKVPVHVGGMKPLADIVVLESVIKPGMNQIELMFSQWNRPENGDKRELSVQFERLDVVEALESGFGRSTTQ